MFTNLLALLALLPKYGPVIMQLIAEVADLLKRKQASGVKAAVSPTELKTKTSEIAKQLADYIYTTDCSIDDQAGVTPVGAQQASGS